MTFANPKQRHGECADMPMSFNGSVQAFSPYDALAAFDGVTPAPERRRGHRDPGRGERILRRGNTARRNPDTGRNGGRQTETEGKGERTPPPSDGKAGRWPVLNAFVDSAMSGLTRAELTVWLALFRDTKRVTGLARTGQTDLARRCGCSVRAVQTAIQSLRGKGLLTLVRRGRINAGTSVYRVTLPG